MRVLSVKVQVNTCYLACHVTRGPGSKPTQAVDWVSHSLCQSRVSTGGCAARTSFKVLLLLPCFQTDHPYTHQPACLPARLPSCLPAYCMCSSAGGLPTIVLVGQHHYGFYSAVPITTQVVLSDGDPADPSFNSRQMQG